MLRQGGMREKQISIISFSFLYIFLLFFFFFGRGVFFSLQPPIILSFSYTLLHEQLFDFFGGWNFIWKIIEYMLYFGSYNVKEIEWTNFLLYLSQ